ncbi:MAG TPA: AzlC family ABC transporter permease [Steroidobacteraceae bacterium]|nr:AzlC family ABC transporter permease [Steroidobacteraceae bacterium]
MLPADEVTARAAAVGTHAREAFRRGVLDLLPVIPGVLAWGIVTGIAMVQAGLTLGQSLGMTLAAYAGSAQLAALPLMVAAAPVWVVALTAVVVNLRFVIYSLALRPQFRDRSRRARLALGYFTGDITFLKFAELIEKEPDFPHRVPYFAGSAACNWAGWQVGSIAGILGAGFIPPDSGLDLAGTLALVALVVPLCTRLPALAGVTVAGVVSVVARGWPLKLGLLAAIVCGIAAAMAADAFAARRRQAS